MARIEIEEKYILEYIKDMLNSMKNGRHIIETSCYHHNARYETGASICTHGILSLQDLARLGIIEYDEQQFKLFSDTASHANGVDGISLSLVGLSDLYKDEDEYTPYIPDMLDFLITRDIKARRYTTHYGNEFLSQTSILPEQLRSLDIRMLRLIRELEKKPNKKDTETLAIINKYNCLGNIASTLVERKLYLPIREMSEEDAQTLDIDRLSKTPTLILKK